MPGRNYYVEDEFNSYISKINPKFSVFHLNFKSLNCHHKELVTYLQLLDSKFDCICLSEVWSYYSILKLLHVNPSGLLYGSLQNQ